MRPGFDLAGKRVLVVGLARTGLAVSLFGAGHGATVTASDQRSEEELGETAARLRQAGVQLRPGGHSASDFLNQDLIVLSPGVPADLPLVEQARTRGIPVWSEIELGWRFLRGKVVAITGSNGKTTTASLAAHILKAANLPVALAGNIGVPLVSGVENSTDATITVLEASSFQLETIEAFRPDIGVLLNLTPDHLDRHASFEAYARAKLRVFENQAEQDAAVLNADDAESARRMPTRPHVYWFSRQKRVAAGTFVRDGQIVFRREGAEVRIAAVSDLPLRGAHNLENALAACAATYLAGADPTSICAGLKSFQGVEHRLEFVAEIGGVSFYNDSKATNVDAAVKAIEAFPGRLLVILGGKDKRSPYTPLREPLRQRGRLAILIGAAEDKIAAEIAGVVPIEHAGTLERAVAAARAHAQSGDVVLLAPACASFDQFENYEQRGRVFKQLVNELKSGSAAAGQPRAPMQPTGAGSR